MVIDLGVQVPPEPGRRNRSETQGVIREDEAEGSAERNREPTNRNRIEGATKQGERALNREALTTKERWRKSGGCAVKADDLTWGDLASRLKGRREVLRSEESAEAIVRRVKTRPKGRTRERMSRPEISKEDGVR